MSSSSFSLHRNTAQYPSTQCGSSLNVVLATAKGAEVGKPRKPFHDLPPADTTFGVSTSPKRRTSLRSVLRMEVHDVSNRTHQQDRVKDFIRANRMCVANKQTSSKEVNRWILTSEAPRKMVRHNACAHRRLRAGATSPTNQEKTPFGVLTKPSTPFHLVIENSYGEKDAQERASRFPAMVSRSRNQKNRGRQQRGRRAISLPPVRV